MNVVAEVTSFLHTYASYLSSENLGHINKVLQSLIEMCVGNIKNQQVVLDKLIVEPLNRILQIPLPTTSHQCTTENVIILLNSLAVSIHSLYFYLIFSVLNVSIY